MSVIVKFGKQYVIKPSEREEAVSRSGNGEDTIIPEPNFEETGQALCGIIKEDETLPLFRKRWIRKRKKNALEAMASAEYMRELRKRKKETENAL